MSATFYRDVIIIGAGWSGLLACKNMLEEDLSVIVLEKRDNIGGLWCYSDNPDVLTVMKRSQSTSSSSLTEISDFPMSDEMDEFPTHGQIYQYLQQYCNKFNLYEHIRLNCGVASTKKVQDTWHVKVEDGSKYYSKYLAVCTGVHQIPNRELESTLFSAYTGEIIHSRSLKSFIPEHQNKTVLVVGGGETAADIVEEWHQGGAKQIIWSIPRGQHFFRKYAKILPYRPAQALDKASSRVMNTLAPFTKGKPGLSWVCFWTTNGSLLSYQGHGVPEWKNDAQFFHFFINKNGHVLDLVDYKKVVPKGAIKSVLGNTVQFVDGEKADVDVVIQCTGYRREFPFLPSTYQVPLTNHYKFIFNVDDPSIAFIGYARPVVGSIPIISEVQSIYAARVFSGSIALPKYVDFVNESNQDKDFWSNYFKDSSKRIDTLVELYTYMDDVGEKAGLQVDYWKLFINKPREWLTVILAPGCSSIMRLNEKSKRSAALDNLRRRGDVCFSPVQYIWIVFLRMVWFDWWLKQLGEIKFFFQTNPVCRKIKEWRVVRFLDWIWTTPKRMLFDNKSRPPRKDKVE